MHGGANDAGDVSNAIHSKTYGTETVAETAATAAAMEMARRKLQQKHRLDMAIPDMKRLLQKRKQKNITLKSMTLIREKPVKTRKSPQDLITAIVQKLKARLTEIQKPVL